MCEGIRCRLTFCYFSYKNYEISHIAWYLKGKQGKWKHMFDGTEENKGN